MRLLNYILAPTLAPNPATCLIQPSHFNTLVKFLTSRLQNTFLSLNTKVASFCDNYSPAGLTVPYS
jgi:hypothetical protein